MYEGNGKSFKDNDELFYKPSWKIRRRFFAFTVGFSSFLVLYVIFKWEDLQIATELIAMASALWLGVLGFYTAGATLEDVRLFRDEFDWFRYANENATDDPNEGQITEEDLR